MRACRIRSRPRASTWNLPTWGGSSVNSQIKLLAEFQNVAREFSRREIQIKDPERGLIDFPAIIAGREVFLSWESDEDSIEFWHDLETGYGGRERL